MCSEINETIHHVDKAPDLSESVKQSDMTVTGSDRCDRTSKVTIFIYHIFCSIYNPFSFITTLRVAAELNPIAIYFCTTFLCSCKAFLTARTLTTVTPTQFLGF